MKTTNPPSDTAEPPNPWKETVRDIFDLAHFRGDNSAFARRVIALIEERHRSYFCAGKRLSKLLKETNDEPK